LRGISGIGKCGIHWRNRIERKPPGRHQIEGDQQDWAMWHTLEKPYRKETTWKTYTSMGGERGAHTTDWILDSEYWNSFD
jgi:hypothetical protein